MKNNDSYRALSGLSVNIDNVVYMPTLDAPADKPHPFIYFISILNASDETVTITGRKWVVREGDGELTVVEGEGVVGQNPEIPSMEHFSYNSYHVVADKAVASGMFFGVTAKGVKVFAQIPEFALDAPDWV